MRDLAVATKATDELFGSDINITYRLLNQLLQYENTASGLNLTSEQDSTYIQVGLEYNLSRIFTRVLAE